MEDLRRHVLCIDRDKGKVLWTKEFKPESCRSTSTRVKDRTTATASSTPVTDGERLYVFFGKSGVYCFDLDGKAIWRRRASARESTAGARPPRPCSTKTC